MTYLLLTYLLLTHLLTYVDRQVEQTSAFTCPECGSKRCTVFNTNSMGLEVASRSEVPDMIMDCIDCGHRSTI